MARKYLRRGKYTPRENNSFWLTFSDLMSALVLVFVLVMFYSVYQYFDMLELKTAELMRQSGLLDQKQVELESKDLALTAKDEELQQSLGKLTESEKALAQQQYQLLLTKQAQEEAEKSLADQRKDLDDALALLSMREEDLQTARALVDSQQLKLDSQQAKLDDQQLKLDELVGVRAQIVKSLGEALRKANVKANVDAQGSITLDASVLFDVGKSELKDSGKLVLDQFLPVYLGVLLQDDNLKNISEIIIEGHTDSTGNYLDNLKLSQERALNVMSYVLSDENKNLDLRMKQKLRKIGTANGRSFSNLKLDAQGLEDAESSRRVEFKFRMQDEQMIESMREILSSMDAAQ